MASFDTNSQITAALAKFFAETPNLRKACPRCNALATIHLDPATPGTLELHWSRPAKANYQGGHTEWTAGCVSVQQEFMDPDYGCGYDD